MKGKCKIARPSAAGTCRPEGGLRAVTNRAKASSLRFGTEVVGPVNSIQTS